MGTPKLLDIKLLDIKLLNYRTLVKDLETLGIYPKETAKC